MVNPCRDQLELVSEPYFKDQGLTSFIETAFLVTKVGRCKLDPRIERHLVSKFDCEKDITALSI